MVWNAVAPARSYRTGTLVCMTAAGSEHLPGCPWADDPQANRIDVVCPNCGVTEEQARALRPAGQPREHELECDLHAECRLTSNGLHDYSRTGDWCLQCTRSCTCRQLRAHGQRVLRDWVAKGITSGSDAWMTVRQVNDYAEELEATERQRAVDTVLDIARTLPSWNRTDTTHFDGCWQSHTECLARRILEALGWPGDTQVAVEGPAGEV